jgi:hypothetical protein
MTLKKRKEMRRKPMKKESTKKKEAMSKVTITSDMQSESLVSQLLSYMIWRR